MKVCRRVFEFVENVAKTNLKNRAGENFKVCKLGDLITTNMKNRGYTFIYDVAYM